MKRRIFITILVLVLFSQIPFAYRRYRLARLRTVIANLSTQRASDTAGDDYVDYKGVIHVHTSLGGHSNGTFAELIAAAKANQLDFVMMTEHQQAEFTSSALTLDGTFGQTLFVRGNEIVTTDGDRILLLGGVDTAGRPASQTTKAVVTIAHPASLTIEAYPTESQNWKAAQVDGVEVYNLFTNTKEANRLTLVFDGLWSYRGYADLMFANFFSRPDENLRQWDQAMSNSNRKLVAIAGNDAHSNIGVSLNDESGSQLIGIKLDPYERSFRTVRTHVLIKKEKGLSRESLLEALAQGHCYISFDLFSDASGFRFATSDSTHIMGDDLAASDQLKLIAKAPLAVRFVLLKNGSTVNEKSGTSAEFAPNGPGVYRLEAYLNGLTAPASGKPWVISNPIYVR